MRRNSLVLKVIPLLFLEDTRRVKSHQTMKLPEINLNDIFLCLFLGRARLLSQKGIANGRLSEKRVGIFLPLPKATPGLHAHWQQLASALVCSSPGSGTNSYCCWTNTQEIGKSVAQEQGHYTARLYCH